MAALSRKHIPLIHEVYYAFPCGCVFLFILLFFSFPCMCNFLPFRFETLKCYIDQDDGCAWTREEYLQRRAQLVDGRLLAGDASFKYAKVIRLSTGTDGTRARPVYGIFTIMNEYDQVCKPLPPVGACISSVSHRMHVHTTFKLAPPRRKSRKQMLPSAAILLCFCL